MQTEINTNNQQKASAAKIFAMAGTYCLGVFNDNYFKQAALLLAVTTGMAHLQGPATVLFSLPFILCSSYAGWIADRFAKRNVVRFSKGLEVIAMLIGAAGILLINWPCILAMIFLMSLQSTFFSPALNASIPELFSEEQVAKANGFLKLVTTLSILLGIAIAGLSLDAKWPVSSGLASSRSLIAIVAVGVAVFGFLASLGVYSKEAAGVKRSFPWWGPVSSLKDARDLFADHKLRKAILANTIFYFLASTAVLTINLMGIKQLGFSQSLTSLLSVCLMLGISAGAVLVSRFFSIKQWDRFLFIGILGMAVGLFVAAFTIFVPAAFQKIWIISGLTLAGFAGGVFLIPITSFLQIYPQRSEKGRVLGTTNFCSFIGIMCSGFVFSALSFLFSPAGSMAALGALALCCALLLLLERTTLIFIGSRLLFALLSLRYRITVKGLENIKAGDMRGTLFLPNHPALIDPVLISCILYGKGVYPRPLSDQNQVNKPGIRLLMKLIQPIVIPDMSTEGRGGKARIKEALAEMAHRLNKGDDILLYPAGRLYRCRREDLASNSAVESLLQNTDHINIILVRTTGLWGSRFSRASGKQPGIGKELKGAVTYLAANLLFFGPRRNVTIEFHEDNRLRKLSSRKEINSYLENFYNQTSQPHISIPSYWWQGRKPEIKPEPEKRSLQNVAVATAPGITRDIIKKIKELSGANAKAGDSLARDLGMDSLTVMELASWLEEEYGITIDDLGSLETVERCIHAASGIVLADNLVSKPVPAQWFTDDKEELKSPQGETMTDIFLAMARKHPNKLIAGDQIAGYKTYRDILTAIFLLREKFVSLPGKRVGIMLPAAVSAGITYLASLFAGKTPVMYNWTVGTANMDHGIEKTDTKCIITSRVLYQKIRQQGCDLDSLHTRWIFLEDIVKNITMLEKIRAALQARFRAHTLSGGKADDTAVILFTSGSESVPKAVPLSHANIKTNLNDVMRLHRFKNDDCLLAMLPPFHSLGLSGTILLPLCIGMRTIYHANPTESAILARLVHDHRTSITIGTPTFLAGILKAGGKDKLTSLRLLLAGAEKCPESLHTLLQQTNKNTILCEGYGITECSPLVSLNTIEENRPGTIGRPVPSVTYVIVNPESGEEVKRGERGLLLLQGPNIFSGYLGEEKGKGFRTFNDQIWYDTGDFVVEDEEGFLSFRGRQKRFIKIGGEMISLPAIENILHVHFPPDDDGKPACAIEGIGSEQHPEIVFFTVEETTRTQINDLIHQAGLSPLHKVRKVVKVDEIPVLGTGKTDYQALKHNVLKSRGIKETSRQTAV